MNNIGCHNTARNVRIFYVTNSGKKMRQRINSKLFANSLALKATVHHPSKVYLPNT